ncbi:unnamed protein product [Hymenolepis diminuta]|uniref:Uncharacterized protein n=1 Tax=Hymenolepis diminuta TaxID=6216 RepID=A0A564Z834_HYMDI|nr:unnamed protein product [Hymenolepis diminuta]
MAEDPHLGLCCSSHNSGVDVGDIPQHMWKVRMVSSYKIGLNLFPTVHFHLW